jgi:DNA-directed RNA polymerase specialized sigma24 family protein
MPLRDEPYEAPEPAIDLVRTLCLLPKQRAAVVLRYYGGYAPREIAGLIGSTAGAVRVHLVLARHRLKELLSEGDDHAT